MNVSTLGSVRCQNCGLCIVLIALCRPLWQGFIQFCSVGAVLKRLREKQARDELFIEALCDDEQPRKRNTGPRPGGSNAAGRTDYDDSTWARMLIDHAADLRNPRSLWARKFRRRFRLPFPIFLLLLKRTRAVSARPSFLCSWCTSVTERISLPSFLQWVEYDEETNPSGIKATDAAGRARCPTALKLLGVLRILGRGTDLDSINELSGISEPVMNHFFHRWCKWARDVLSAEYLKFPESDEELSKVMGAFSALGFPGALGSMDVVHFNWGGCPAAWANLCTGKEGFPTLAYEAICDHSGCVIALTPGHYGAYNDKTIVRFDSAIRMLRTSPRFTEAK